MPITDYYNEPRLGKYSKGQTRGIKTYRMFLNEVLRGKGLGAEQAYRNQAYSGVAGQAEQANQQGQRTLSSGFGANNPTGLSAALRSQTALGSPYGEADLAAQEAGRRSMIQTGSALEASKQNQANWYRTLLDPLFQEYSLQLQKQALEDQAAYALAGAAGGGGGDAFLGGLGSGLGQGASSNIAGG